MKSGISLLCLLFAFLLIQAYARTDRLGEAVHVGRVEAIFDEVSAGIFTARTADTIGRRLSSWAHVRFASPLEDGRAYAVARLPEGLQVQPDDDVAVRFGDSSPDDALGAGLTTITSVIGRGRPLALN
ncbi:MAG: hypothetical protein IT532_06610 [Burkholderiales bacterium]|nr:hypothetical protein [Burkholderiales bacterium]